MIKRTAQEQIQASQQILYGIDARYFSQKGRKQFDVLFNALKLNKKKIKEVECDKNDIKGMFKDSINLCKIPYKASKK
jgi:hypothetical protein